MITAQEAARDAAEVNIIPYDLTPVDVKNLGSRFAHDADISINRERVLIFRDVSDGSVKIHNDTNSQIHVIPVGGCGIYDPHCQTGFYLKNEEQAK